jgi:hypothetical protein
VPGADLGFRHRGGEAIVKQKNSSTQATKKVLYSLFKYYRRLFLPSKQVQPESGAILPGGLHKARAYPPILQENCQIYVANLLCHGLELFSSSYVHIEERMKQTCHTTPS